MGRFERMACDAHDVDAVAVAFRVWQVVAEVGPIDGDRLAPMQHDHIGPDHLLIAKTWPTVARRLLDERRVRATPRGDEERAGRGHIVEDDFLLAAWKLKR
eukprot:CAMPEP_0181207236 /NCGR_PEP_ID=MMETSP1096-20121128/21475_1 /TAXON_ID=156174 ORGANISM="Chrysochromulina ericina, Strain CCMP281" /NCGR_SAMPLE_ID=MMETSP1096 /ASSEMBLY_ACC=CAM_ASM_000453 /LENGTH=100 /DNA_ID=CAMNT_0023298217 /DNA_START=567 /DNA_END=869 /DNA_ORIENTATION=+